MKRLGIVLFISCFLLLSNVTIAIGSTSSKVSIKSPSTTTTIVNTDKPLIDEKKIIQTDEAGTAPPAQDDKITDQQQDTEPTFGINNEEQAVSENQITVQPGEQATPESEYIGISNAGGPYQGQAGSPIAFHSKGIIQIGATYKWDFGDNSNPVYGRNPSHTYSENGIYWVTLKVTRTNGETYLDIAPVYIGQQGNSLVPSGGYSYQGEVGQEITFDASNSISTNPNAYPLKYRWDFGEGDGYTSWSTSPTTTHTYEKERVYQVKLEIKDKYGHTRYDVLHADIGCSFSSFRNFFLNNDGVLDDVISLLYDNQDLGSIFCQWLQIKLYYKYNNNPGQTFQIYNLDSQNFPIDLDVNSDGVNDVRVGGMGILAPTESYGSSPFNPTADSAIQFNSFISGVGVLPGGCVGTDDDLTLCVQFTFPPFFVGIYDLLGINLDPTVKLGVEFDAGKEKPTVDEPVSVAHYFKPYLIQCLQQILTGEVSQQPQENPYQNEQINNEMILNNQQNTYQYTTTYVPSYSSAIQEIAQEGALDINSGNLQINAQQSQPIMPEDISNIYPEQGLSISGTNGKSISLVASVSTNTGYTITFKAAFESLFSPFTMTHRMGQTLRDVNISENDDSAVTFSITAENEDPYSSATLGMMISPARSLNLHVNIDRTTSPKHALINIDTPPKVAVIFIETESAGGQQNGRYFYMKNIPTSINLTWNPSLDNGYVHIKKESSSGDFKIGLCNDLQNPDVDLYFTSTNKYTNLSWQISLDENLKSITLGCDVVGLTLNAKLRNVTQPNQKIDFVATIQNALDLTIKWNPQEGYFSLDRSETTIDFSFVVSQDNLILDVNGVYATGSGEGLKFTFNNFQNGVIELDSGKEIGLNIKAFNPASETILETELIFEQSGKTTVNWSNDLNYIKLDSDHTITFDNFRLSNPEFNIAASEIKLQNSGNVKLTWDHYKHLAIDTSTNFAATFDNFDVTAENFDISADEVKLAGSSTFGLSNEDKNLQFSGANQVTLTNFEGNIRFWSGTISYAKSVGDFNILLEPANKYYYLNMQNKLNFTGFDIKYDSPDDQYDTEFGVDAFNMEGGSSIWFNFSSSPKFQMAGYNIFAFNDLHLKIGPKLAPTIDFSIPTFAINGVGQIYSEINNQHLLVSADVAFSWGIDLQSMNYGSWQVDGSYSGSGTMNLTEWQPGVKGQVTFAVNTPIHHNLKVTHGELELELDNMTLNPGSSTIKWKREQLNSNGYLNITSDVSGSLTLRKLTYNDSQNPVEFSMDTIQLQPIKLNVSWQMQTNSKTLHINNNHTIDIGLIKIVGANKTLTIGSIGLKSGQFNVVYDTVNKMITLNNGMNAFGPLCTYEDADRELSVDLLNLVNDYSKTMTLKWYQDSSNKITGLSLDTDGSQLVDWITFTSIRKNQDPSQITGRRIALGGFQADDFKIMIDTSNPDHPLNVSGRLYLANHFTYSKLVNYYTDQWKNLDVQWDLNLDGVGSIEINTDPGFIDDITLSTTLGGTDISATIEQLNPHLKLGWDVDFNGQGNISIDNDYAELPTITFEISKDKNGYYPKWGFRIGAEFLRADDYKLIWNFTSYDPRDWELYHTGDIDFASLSELSIAWNSVWYDLLSNGGSPSPRES